MAARCSARSALSSTARAESCRRRRPSCSARSARNSCIDDSCAARSRRRRVCSATLPSTLAADSPRGAWCCGCRTPGGRITRKFERSSSSTEVAQKSDRHAPRGLLRSMFCGGAGRRRRRSSAVCSRWRCDVRTSSLRTDVASSVGDLDRSACTCEPERGGCVGWRCNAATASPGGDWCRGAGLARRSTPPRARPSLESAGHLRAAVPEGLPLLGEPRCGEMRGTAPAASSVPAEKSPRGGTRARE